MRKSRIVDSTRFLQDFQCQVGNRNLKESEKQTGISITLYYAIIARKLQRTLSLRRFWPLQNSHTSFTINCATLWTFIRELSFRTWETTTGLLNLRASEPCKPQCEPCESCESFLRVFFFFDWSRVWEIVDHFPLSLSNRYKPPARLLECEDDPGDEYKQYNLAPRVATKVLKIEIFPAKVLISLSLPELLPVRHMNARRQIWKML